MKLWRSYFLKYPLISANKIFLWEAILTRMSPASSSRDTIISWALMNFQIILSTPWVWDRNDGQKLKFWRKNLKFLESSSRRSKLIHTISHHHNKSVGYKIQLQVKWCGCIHFRRNSSPNSFPFQRLRIWWATNERKSKLQRRLTGRFPENEFHDLM